MKNKIIMFALMCALLVGFVPMHHVTKAYAASGVGGYFEGAETFMHNITDDMRVNMEKYHYVVFGRENDGYVAIRIFDRGEVPAYLQLYNDGRDRIRSLDSNKQEVASSLYFREYGQWCSGGYGSEIMNSSNNDCLIYASSISELYDSNWNVIADNIPTIEEYLGEDVYSFAKWCSDAGLNCQASSNESSSFMPYSYNDYMHIVRRTGLDKYGRWVLTTIGNSIIGDNLSDYTLMVDDNGELQVYALYSGEEEQGYQLFVRNYVYDTDGWKLISFELFDTREDDDFIIELGEDSAINDVNLLAYTSVDIYDDGLNILHPASTEYYDVNDILPDVPEQPEEPEEPIVTPTGVPLPTVVPPISAGQATVTKNRTAIYEEPSSTSQVQHYLFEGGVVYVVEEYGEDWYYVRYDMGGLSYTGYVAQDNVNYDVDNGFASEDVIDGYEGQVDDLLGMVGNVPKMIYALFSFLPPWCLALVGVSFTAMLALIGWKILRG